MKPKKFFDTMQVSTELAAYIHQDMLRVNTDVDPHSIRSWFLEKQNESTLKKVEAEGDKEALEKEAFDDFLHRNRQLSIVNGVLARGSVDDSSVVGCVLRRAQHLIHWILADITTVEVYNASRHSGGVTREVPYMDTSLIGKSRFPWTCTERIAPFLRSYFTYDPLYAKACEGIGGSMPNEVLRVMPGSRFTTVPKTAKKRRLICVEPTGNMFLQQGLMKIMYSRLRSVGLDLETLPDRHRDLAFWGSISGSIATLDLSNASDSVSYELVRLLFPAKWFSWLCTVRCSTAEIAGEMTTLSCFSTMGNATTFPVETLVFYALAVSCLFFYDRVQPHYGVRPWRHVSVLSLPSEREACSVFGDDIIVPSRVAPFLVYILGEVGFTLNKEKSFYGDERFRESCGGDFLIGRAVRPFYITGPASQDRFGLEAWLYVMSNSLLKMYRSYIGGVGYFYESQAFAFIFRELQRCGGLVKVVPRDFPDDSGLQGLEGLRLARCYTKRISPIGETTQGWAHFKYLSYRYPRSLEVPELLNYANWLKVRQSAKARWSDFLPLLEPTSIKPLRKRGRYVVKRTTAPFVP